MRGLPMQSQWQAAKLGESKLWRPILGWKASTNAAVFKEPRLPSRCKHTNWSRYQQRQVTVRRHLAGTCRHPNAVYQQVLLSQVWQPRPDLRIQSGVKMHPPIWQPQKFGIFRPAFLDPMDPMVRFGASIDIPH